MALQLPTRCKPQHNIGNMVVQIKQKPLAMSAPKTLYFSAKLWIFSMQSTPLVRTAGLEPAWAYRPRDFRTSYGFHRHLVEVFVVWTIPSP